MLVKWHIAIAVLVENPFDWFINLNIIRNIENSTTVKVSCMVGCQLVIIILN